jgi:hypothetical protein
LPLAVGVLRRQLDFSIYAGVVLMKLASRILLLSFTSVCAVVSGQDLKSANQQELTQTLALERSALLSDLHSLDYQSLNLSALARASVKAELADAAWDIDRQWSKKLLTKAYELTWPTEDDQMKLRSAAMGAQPTPPGPSDRARRAIRNRIVQIAGKEQRFADELIQSAVKQLGSAEGQMAYATLARNALRNDDLETAGKYVMQSADLDPSQIAAGFLIVEMTRSDRKKADELTIQYLQRLMTFPLSSADNSFFRVYLLVHRLVAPVPEVKPPGPEVMRAYAAFVIQSLGNLEQREPGSLQIYRPQLLLAYPAVKQYAPDLMPEFVALEQRSRAAGNTSSLETDANELMTRQQNRNEATSENEKGNEREINQYISSHDFTKARKLVDKLANRADRERLAEIINAKESLYVLGQDKVFEARALAEKLQQATNIQEVYVGLIVKCLSRHNDSLAQDLMIQAMKQLKRSNPIIARGTLDMPAEFAPTSRETDPILEGIAKLTIVVSSSSSDVAMLGLAEIVAAANQSEIDTAQGRPGFDVNVFKKLAPNDESRIRLGAESFKDPFRRMLSLAAIDQWKAASIAEREKILRTNSKPVAGTTPGGTKN